MDLFKQGLVRFVVLLLNDVHIPLQFGHLSCHWTLYLVETL